MMMAGGRNTAQYPSARTEDGLVVLRVDAPIYFANVQHIKDHIRSHYCTVSHRRTCISFSLYSESHHCVVPKLIPMAPPINIPAVSSMAWTILNK